MNTPPQSPPPLFTRCRVSSSLLPALFTGLCLLLLAVRLPAATLLEEGFEGAGYQNTGWSPSISTTLPDPDYTGFPLVGAQSLRCNGASFAQRSFARTAPFYLYFQARWLVWQDFKRVVEFLDGGGNATLKVLGDFGRRVQIIDNADPILLPPGTFATGSTIINDNTTYHFWLEWTPATDPGFGTNGTLKLFIANTGAKPANPEVTVTNGTVRSVAFLDVGPFDTAGTPPPRADVIYDNVLISDAPLGNQGGNLTPSITPDIQNQTILLGTLPAPIAFTVSDPETPATALVVTATSSNPTLVPNTPAALNLQGTAGPRTLTVTPATGQFGASTITVRATDGTNTAVDDFVLTVNQPGGGGGGGNILLREAFEASPGYDTNGWVEVGTAPAPNPDYTAFPLQGTQSLFLTGGSSINRGFVFNTSFNLYSRVRFTPLSAGSSVFQWWLAGFGAVVGSLQVDFGDRLTLSHGAAAASSPVGSITSNTTYHVWVEWTHNSGTTTGNGTMKVFFSTDGIKPAVAQVSLVTGNGADPGLMVVGPYSGGAGMIFDALLASDLPLGDNPFAGGTGGGVTPTITWANPAPIVYGTALSGVQLNATASAPGVASVPGTFTYAPAAGAVLNAGNAQTLSVTFTPTDPVAYNPVTKPVSLNVSQKALTIAAGPNQTKVYGAANPTFNPLVYTGFVNGDTPASLDTAATVGTTATASSPVGTYPITVSGAVDVNYLITFVNGTLTVNQAPLSITADNKTRLYGAANPAPTLSYSGFVNGDTVASLDTAATAGTTATPASPVGTYPITVSGAADVNYAITFVNGALLVGRAPLTITADNKTKVYGAANPAPTLSYSGFVNGETAAVLDTAATVGTTATPASPVGTYPITVSGAVDANYAITFVNGTLSVGQAVLTITADNKTKVYGAANPAPTLSYSGFVNGDTAAVLDTAATVGTTATPASPVGTYPITVSGAVDANYAIAFVNGLLSVGRAPLTITADNKTRPVGAANPTFTASYAGFVNGDTPASLDTPVSFSTTAATGSPAGTYPITPLGAVDVNYTIAFVAGTLTVTPVAATTPVLTWADPAPIVYGTALSGVQLNATASAAGVAVVPGTFAYTPGAGAVLNAGVGQTLSVTFTPTDLATYLPATKTVRVTVTPAPLIITADNKTRQQNTANPTLTASYAGFVNNDTAASLDTPVTLTTTAVPSSPTGQYPIVASGAADVNYSITLRNGVLTVTPVTISQLPPPWQNQDVGAVGVAGSASFVDGNEVDMDDDPNLRFRDGIFTINGSGADIGGQADAFQFAYQPWTGDGEVIALVSGIGSADPVAKVGVMFRESLAPDSRHVSMFLHPGGGVFFQRRTAAGAASLSTSIPGLAVPYWVRVTRIGDSFLGYVSEDGWSWFLVGAETLHLPATIQVGLAVTAHNSAALNTATITGVETRLPEVALPEPWLHQDVGAVGSAGSAIFNECTYLVTGSGADIGGQADAFQFVYQPWTGDGDIITRLASVDPTDPGAKAGVMFRASLALDSANALMAVTPGAGGAVFQQRKTTGGATVATADPTHTVPTWLRLTRIGNLFLGYVSADAEIWSFVGAETIVMPPTIQVGLAVTAHNNAARNTSAFTQVDIAPPDLPTIAISSPRANRTFVAPCTVTLGVDVSHNCSVYKKTEFYANGVLLGEDNVDYSFIWNPTVVGTYVLTARAVFYGDLTVTSLPVTITVAARPSTPVGLTATASAPDRITLAWSAGSGGSAAAGYVVERAAPGGSYVQVGTTGPATFTFSEGGLTQGKTYYYRVRGTNALGSSAPSVMAVGRTFLPRIQVNFQPAAAPVPAGYLVDSGLPFRSRGNGYSYGWNINNSAFAVDRDSPNSANQAYDTFQYMQLCATVWEIAVPNGWYTVSIVAGDATLIDSTYRISVEGTPTVTGTPTTAARWVSGTATVNVADGRLTVVNGAGAVNNKICFISIDQVSGPGTPNNNITPNLNLFAAASVSEGSTPALPKVAWLGRDPGNQFTLQVLGVPEGGYEIEASEDLLHWVTQPVVPNLDGTVSFEDPLADARSRRFFRARILQP